MGVTMIAGQDARARGTFDILICRHVVKLPAPDLTLISRSLIRCRDQGTGTGVISPDNNAAVSGQSELLFRMMIKTPALATKHGFGLVLAENKSDNVVSYEKSNDNQEQLNTDIVCH